MTFPDLKLFFMTMKTLVIYTLKYLFKYAVYTDFWNFNDFMKKCIDVDCFHRFSHPIIHWNLVFYHPMKIQLEVDTYGKVNYKWWIILTWHPVEESFSSSIVGLQEAAVHGPVQVCYEAGGLVALSHFLIALGHSVDVHKPVVGAHGQIRAIGWELELVNDLLPVLDVDHLRHVPSKTRQALSLGIMKLK